MKKILDNFLCISCNSNNLIEKNKFLICGTCNQKYPRVSGIYIFNNKNISLNKHIWDNRASLSSGGDIVVPNKSISHLINSDIVKKELITEILPRILGKSCLEVGCGKGQFLKLFKKFGKYQEVYGADYSLNMLENCPNDIIKINCDASSLPLKNNSVDIIFFITVLMHNKNIQKIIEEAKRVARKHIIIFENTSSLIPRILDKSYVFPRKNTLYKQMFEDNAWSLSFFKERRGIPLKHTFTDFHAISFILSKQSWMIFKKNG